MGPVVPVRTRLTAVRAAAPLMADDCVVDAENAAEIEACSDPTAPQTAAPLTADDCIVDAENASEIAACSDDAVVAGTPQRDGWTSVPFEECIVDAENAKEIAACADP